MKAIIPPEYTREDYGEGWVEYTFTIPLGIEGEDLPALVKPDENTAVSFWKPNELEMDAIAKGHVIALTVIGSQPPVVLNVI